MALYLATIRKTIAAFGSLFNDISINRFEQAGGEGASTKTIKVPLSYAPSHKFLRIINETIRDNSTVRLKYTLPRMSFEMTGLSYDASRKLLSMNSTCPTQVTTGNVVQYFKQLNPVPYTYNFNLNIAAKQTEDILQIVEQIFPKFTPSYNITIKDVPKLNISRDVPIIIDTIEQSDNYDGNFEDNRVIVWTISFRVLGYIYPPISDAEVIKKVISTLSDPSTELLNSKITVSVNPLNAEFDENWDINTIIEDFNVT